MILTRPLRQWTRVTRRAVAVIHLFALAAPPGEDDDEDVTLIWQPLLFSVQHSSSHILPYSHSLPHPNIHPQNHSHHHRHPHKSQIPPPPPNHDPHVKVKQEFVMWFRPYGFCYFKLRWQLSRSRVKVNAAQPFIGPERSSLSRKTVIIIVVLGTAVTGRVDWSNGQQQALAWKVLGIWAAMRPWYTGWWCQWWRQCPKCCQWWCQWWSPFGWSPGAYWRRLSLSGVFSCSNQRSSTKSWLDSYSCPTGSSILPYIWLVNIGLMDIWLTDVWIVGVKSVFILLADIRLVDNPPFINPVLVICLFVCTCVAL